MTFDDLARKLSQGIRSSVRVQPHNHAGLSQRRILDTGHLYRRLYALDIALTYIPLAERSSATRSSIRPETPSSLSAFRTNLLALMKWVPSSNWTAAATFSASAPAWANCWCNTEARSKSGIGRENITLSKCHAPTALGPEGAPGTGRLAVQNTEEVSSLLQSGYAGPIAGMVDNSLSVS